MTMGDFDGDGIYDVLRPMNDTWVENNVTAFQLCHVSRAGPVSGTVDQACENWTGPIYYGVAQGTLFTQPSFDLGFTANRSMFLGDFNGDGKQDIVTYLGNGQWQVHAAANQAKPYEALDKLVSVTNGVGNTERIDYALPNDPAVYQSMVSQRPNGDNNVGKLNYPGRPLVKAVHRDNGLAGVRDTSYKYYREALEPYGRGNLGFAQIDRTDVQRGITSTVWPGLFFPYIGVEAAKRDVSALGVVLNDTYNDWRVKEYVSPYGGKTVLPYLWQSTVQRRDPAGGNLGRTGTVVEVDGWGNALSASVLNSSDTNPGGWTTSKTMTYNNDEANWLLGQLTSVTDTRVNDYNTVSRKTSYTYTAAGLLATELRDTADNTQRLLTTYDRSTAPFGLVGKTILQWTENGVLNTRTVSEATYTANGRFVSSVKNAAGHSESRTFDGRTGMPKSVTSPDGLTTLSDADGFGRMRSVSTPDGNVSWTSYKACAGNCPAGATTVMIQEAKRASGERVAVPVLQFADNSGRVVRSLTWGFDGGQVVSDTEYDSLGRVQSIWWPGAGTATSSYPTYPLKVRQFYDELDRPAQSWTPDETGAVIWTTNTWAGFKRSTVNGKGQMIQETRDVWGKLASAVDANGKTTTYKFDAFGNLAQTTDPALNQVSVTYDTWGRRTQLKDPDLGVIGYAVNALGQVVSQTSPKQRLAGKSTTMAYDALGRMTSRSADDMTATWTYDVLSGQASCATYKSCGKLVASSTSAGGTALDFLQQHTYDALGRPDATLTTLDVQYVSRTSYDAWGRVAVDVHTRGALTPKTYDRHYNAYGYLARIERAGMPLWTATAQDASGRLTNATLGNGLLASWVYHPYTGRQSSGALQRGAGVDLLREGYVYDVLGNVAQRTQIWGSSSAIENFEYDGLNRLKSAAILGTPQQNFGYDDIGNMLSKTGVGTGAYQYPATGVSSVRPHAVTSIPGVGTFSYDENGNMTSGAGRTITWNTFDMPMVMTQGSETSTFYYGPDRQRVTQVRSDGVTIRYAGAMEVEVKPGATTAKTYLPLGVGVEIDNANGTQLYYTHRDRLGSVVAISDQGGNIVEQLAYDSWGKRRALTAPDTPASLDGVVDNKGFTGHEMLDKLDLVHMNGRVYDPLVARFMSADPEIQSPEHSQSYNRYTYVWNNPTNLTDPTGFEANAPQPKREECDLECRESRRRTDNCKINCTVIGRTGFETPTATGTRETSSTGGPSTNSGGSGPTCTAGSSAGTCATQTNNIVQDGMPVVVVKPDGYVRAKSSTFGVTPADREFGTMLGIAASGLPFDRAAVGLYRGAQAIRAARAARALRTSEGMANSVNGMRLNAQLAAEQAAGARAPSAITEYSEHALEQIAGRDGGIGVSQSALEDAFANPTNIKFAPSKYGPTFQYIGQDATIVVNGEGRVVTGWGTSAAGVK
jgi:RHS repeat-associated protein